MVREDIVDVVEDIRSKKVWEENLEGVDIVFHFAAQTSVHNAEKDAVADFEVNVLPMIHLFEVCKKYQWKPIFLYAGTVTEAGRPVAVPVDETHPDKPETVYDLHKLMADNYLRFCSSQGLVKGAVLRLANVYGPGPESSSADRGVLNMMIRRALRGEELTVYGKGDNLRDYIFVKDVIRAFLFAGKNIDALNGRQFVIGTGKAHSLNEAFQLVGERVKKITGKTVNIVNIDPPSSQSSIDKRNFIADSRSFKSATDWKPEYPLQSGIDHTIKYFIEKDVTS